MVGQMARVEAMADPVAEASLSVRREEAGEPDMGGWAGSCGRGAGVRVD